VRRDEDAGEAEGEKSGESVGDHALLLRCYARRRMGEIDGLCAPGRVGGCALQAAMF
jgi:hypothetical protein